MYIKLIIFFLALIGLSVYKETGTPLQQKNARKKYIIFMMLLLVLQSGLRNLAVGGDTYQYYWNFKEVGLKCYLKLAKALKIQVM